MTVWFGIVLVSILACWVAIFYLLARRRADVAVTHEQNTIAPQAENDSPARRFSYYCGSPVRQLNSFRRRDNL